MSDPATSQGSSSGSRSSMRFGYVPSVNISPGLPLSLLTLFLILHAIDMSSRQLSESEM